MKQADNDRLLSEPAYWFVFCKDELLLQKDDKNSTYSIPYGMNPPIQLEVWNTIHKLTPMSDGSACRTVSIPSPIIENDQFVMIGSNAGDFSNYYTKTEIDGLLSNKQDVLVSGTNIKTINGQSILGGYFRILERRNSKSRNTLFGCVPSISLSQ